MGEKFGYPSGVVLGHTSHRRFSAEARADSQLFGESGGGASGAADGHRQDTLGPVKLFG